MAVVGVVCEYNPFHLGHAKQLSMIRQANPEAVILCAMSGAYVQRGEPAVYSPALRARAAVLCGADLVIELPAAVSLSSAEGFADGAVTLLAALGADTLCFGAESADAEILMDAARLLLSDDLKAALRTHLDAGLSFPAARARAFADLGGDGALLQQPNHILGIEYCKAILSRGLAMKPMAVLRQGDYHAQSPDAENPSATSLRALLEQGGDISAYLPAQAAEVFRGAEIHSLKNLEGPILARLRSMGEGEFEALPYGGEGLWRKLMHAARQEARLEDVVQAVKSKRYTRTRICRMILCAFLHLTADDLAQPAPYVRLLAASPRGRAHLRKDFPITLLHPGEKSRHPYAETERRLRALYALSGSAPGQPDPKEPMFLL